VGYISGVQPGRGATACTSPDGLNVGGRGAQAEDAVRDARIPADVADPADSRGLGSNG
jgi:hypothetical protein